MDHQFETPKVPLKESQNLKKESSKEVSKETNQERVKKANPPKYGSLILSKLQLLNCFILAKDGPKMTLKSDVHWAKENLEMFTWQEKRKANTLLLLKCYSKAS